MPDRRRRRARAARVADRLADPRVVGELGGRARTTGGRGARRSPHWSTRRERLVARQHLRALAGASEDPDEPDPVEAFRTQWLNIWPERRAIAGDERIEPLVDEAAWHELADLERGRDGPARPRARGLLRPRRRRGRVGGPGRRSRARLGSALRPPRRGASTTSPPRRRASRVAPRPRRDAVARRRRGARRSRASSAPGPAQRRVALPRIRELVAERRLVHDGGVELAGQAIGLRVTRGANGLGVWAHSPRADLIRAAAWAVGRGDARGRRRRRAGGLLMPTLRGSSTSSARIRPRRAAGAASRPTRACRRSTASTSSRSRCTPSAAPSSSGSGTTSSPAGRSRSRSASASGYSPSR